jgi:hypothetical protein
MGMQRHTGLPWGFLGKTILRGHASIGRMNTVEDAEFVHLAVNAHEQLVKALTGLLSCCEQHPAFNKADNVITRGRVDAARAALKAADADGG